jgi:O-antigen ligase
MLNKLNKSTLLSCFLVLFLPALLITGPFLSDLCATLIVFIFLVSIKKNSFSLFFMNKFFFFYFVFFIILILSSLNSDFAYLSLKSSVFYIRFILFSFAVYYFLNKDIIFVRYFFIFLFLLFFLILIDGFIQYFNEKNLLGFKLFKQNEYFRVTSFFNNNLKLGSYLTRFFPLFFYACIFLFGKKKYFFLMFPILIAYFVLIFLTGERTAIFLFLLSVIFLTIFIKGFNFKLNLIFTGILGLFIVLIIFNFNSNLKKRIVDQTKFQILQQNNQITFFSIAHQAHYFTSINIFKDKPILGSGPNTFRYECNNIKYNNFNPDACSTHPHNTYIQLLSETGIITSLFVFCLFIYFLFNATLSLFKKNFFFKNNLMVCSVGCILITLWPFVPSGNFFNNWINLIYYMPFGFYLLSLNKKNIL